jgi:hypothetical protein
MRFCIDELILLISAMALTIGCLREPDEFHESIYFSFVLIAILVSIAMAVGRAKAQRSFWVAFSVVSIGYLSFAHLPDADELSPRQDGPEFTTQLLGWAYYEGLGDSLDDPFKVQTSVQVDPFTDAIDDDHADESPFTADGPTSVDPVANDSLERNNLVVNDPLSQDSIACDECEIDGYPAGEQIETDDCLISAIKSLLSQDVWVDTGGLGTIKPYPANIGCFVGSDAGSFFRIGHSAWAIFLGWIAGHFAKFTYRKSHSEH